MPTFAPRSSKETMTFARKLAPVFDETEVIELSRKVDGSFEGFGEIAIDKGAGAARGKPAKDGDTIETVMAEVERVLKEHAEEHGVGNYQIIARGDKKLGRGIEHDAVLAKVVIRVGEGRDTEDEGSSLGVMREAIKLTQLQTASVHAFIDRMDKTNADLSNRLLATHEQLSKNSMVQVKLLEVQLNHDKDRRQEERDERQAAADARDRAEAIAFGKMVFGAYMQHLRDKAAKERGETVEPGAPPTTSTIAMEIRSLLESCNEPERDTLKTALGEDAWSIFTAAANAPDDDQAIAILRKLQATFTTMNAERANEIQVKIVNTIGADRAMRLWAILQRAA